MNGLDIIGFIVEFGIVAVIIPFQFAFFRANKKKRAILGKIFPSKVEDAFSVDKDEYGVAQLKVTGESNSTLEEDIINPINSYLRENKGATDYHILKDLTDRACDKIQEEVDSYNPVPLYLGLCGTMLGIITGIFFLWIGGGLDALLASSASGAGNADAASQGIQHLLGGVAIAMAASFVGVLMTVFGTRATKNAVACNEEGRNRFLSWIQCNLLPQMSSDVVSTLGVFYRNLNNFNNVFSQNSRELKSAFEQIQRAYQGQTEYTKELNKLDIDKAQRAFASLGDATQRINDLNVFLKDSSSYISKIIALNDKLDTADARTKAIEEMGTFFKNEIEQISARKSMLSESVGKIDLALQTALTGLQTSSTEQAGKLQEHLAKVFVDFQKAVDEQQRLLTEKLAESSGLLAQFKRLEAIENKLAKLDRLDDVIASVNGLGGKLDSLQSVMKSSVSSIKNGSVSSPTLFDGGMDRDVNVDVKYPMPAWLAYTTCGVLIIAGVFSIMFPILVKLGVI